MSMARALCCHEGLGLHFSCSALSRGDTLLHRAARKGHLAVVNLLLRNNVNKAGAVELGGRSHTM